MAQAASPKKLGLAVVVSGPSGAGKSTITSRLAKTIPDAAWSVSATTRPRRQGEQHGKHYFFVDRQEFQRKIDAGEFLEYAEYQGNLYGTPEAPVRDAVAAGKVILIEIEVKGTIQLVKRMPESVRVFVLPPSDEELERRLTGRKTESPAQQAGRLEQARREIEFAKTSGTYPYLVVNDIIEDSVDEIARIIEKERTR
jgi:guanylate kinase